MTPIEIRNLLIDSDNWLMILRATEKQALAFGVRLPFAIIPAMIMALLTVFIAEMLVLEWRGTPIKISTARVIFVLLSALYYAILAYPEIFA